jgi:uridine kinase
MADAPALLEPVLLAVTGGSGSGKTTVAHAVAAAAPPGAAVVVSEDRFYRDRSRTAPFDPAAVDFDHVGARDHDLLIALLDELKAGRPVRAPRYCFKNHWRKQGTDRLAPAPLIILEGIHLLSTPELARRFDVTVFVDTPDDVRFIRRLLRDTAPVRAGGRARRFRDVAAQYLTTVRPGHLAFTAPQRGRADLVLVDDSTRVEGPDPAEVAKLAAPILAHPRVRDALQRSKP